MLSGFLLGENWHIVEEYASILQYVVIAAVAIGLAWFLYSRVRSLLASKRAGDRDDAPAAQHDA